MKSSTNCISLNISWKVISFTLDICRETFKLLLSPSILHWKCVQLQKRLTGKNTICVSLPCIYFEMFLVYFVVFLSESYYYFLTLVPSLYWRSLVVYLSVFICVRRSLCLFLFVSFSRLVFLSLFYGQVLAMINIDGFFSLWCNKKIYSMVVISDSSSDHGAHIASKTGNFIC